MNVGLVLIERDPSVSRNILVDESQIKGYQKLIKG